MNLKTTPLYIPLVQIRDFQNWKTAYEGPNYRTQLDRLIALQQALNTDPIGYILDLSKVEHYSDMMIASAFRSYGLAGWTSRMIFTLRKQCGIVGNDHRQANATRLADRPKQDTPVQDIVRSYIEGIDRIIPDSNRVRYSQMEDRLQHMLSQLDFVGIDAFFQQMQQYHLGERPIKAILDALYVKYSIPPGKGRRIGYQYIRIKLALIKAT